MAEKRYRAGKLFNKFLKLTLGAYMRTLFALNIENGQLQGIKPPYVVLANHTNFWDPFLLSLCIPDPVYFVTSDAYFRNPVLKQLLKLVGAIPKRKQVSDASTIRGIYQVVKNKGIIGIFPEGNRNWDGRTLPLLKPTAKLIKSLQLPVFSILFKGAYLAMPRWASSSRRGRLSMEIERVLVPEDIKSLSVNEIFNKISASLEYDEYSSQRLCMDAYTGRNKAEHIELLLFICPRCNVIGSLVSDGDSFGCSKCSCKMSYNTYGFLESADGTPLLFDNPADWNQWQLEQLDNILADKTGTLESPITSDNDIIMRTGGRTGKLIGRNSRGRLSIYRDRIEYASAGRNELVFRIKDISGMNVQFNNQLEFIHDTVLYRFSKGNEVFSAYKYVKIIEKIKHRSE
jgi:1-acyl-sn-glycerol-3-phosphate acyltransferase